MIYNYHNKGERGCQQKEYLKKQSKAEEHPHLWGRSSCNNFITEVIEYPIYLDIQVIVILHVNNNARVICSISY